MRKEEFYREALPDSLGPLEGVKVLEATTAQAGPVAGMVLADLGAEVIKIDQPGLGDIARRLPPFVPSRSELDASVGYLSRHRNKKNITLNLKSPEGQLLFRRLATRVDIVIQNFKPGTLDQWGLGYEGIRCLKPDIIYVSISGYGQYGPYSHKPGYDPVGQAMSGLMSVTGFPDGPPTKTGNAMADNITGWQGAMGAMAALHYRNRTGKGQHVDVCLLDSVLYTTEGFITGAANAGKKWQRTGNRYQGTAPVNTYRCRDGYVCICVALESHWTRLCRILGREDLIDDPRTSSIAARGDHVELVDGVVSRWTQDRSVAEVVSTLDEAQLVVAPVMEFHQVLEDLHIREREMVTEVEHPAAGPIKLFGVASKYSLTPARVRTPAPLLGQHNREVYGGWLGLGEEEIDGLKEQGAI
ncbi:MAG: CoA transferase [Candidatus Tectomicrobia bacterium]|uniref:CoA transferase n=1 Tax=Tectimicrobiota bacterium TaxID=2528274 RepID=A0A932FWQ2_UNCTE|nr:CoA transferase [Candidatus Tectomicrobia bacterium]